MRCSDALWFDADVNENLDCNAYRLVINGNVEPSGSVTAAGSVVVLGRISGRVQAGADGNHAATISALELKPDRLQIAHITAVDPTSLGAASSSRGFRVVSVQGGMLALSSTSGGPALPRQQRAAHSWTAPAKLAIFTGLYAVLAGLALTVAPLSVFGLLFNAQEVTAGWIRVGGILFTLIGLQYLGTGLQDQRGATAFYSASVWSRLYLAAGFALMVAMGQATWGLALLAAINAAGAMSMFRVLQTRAA